MNGFMTVHEASIKWVISERRVQMLCKTGRVKGAIRIGRNWLIPKELDKPKDGRITSGEYKNWRKEAKEIEIDDVW